MILFSFIRINLKWKIATHHLHLPPSLEVPDCPPLEFQFSRRCGLCLLYLLIVIVPHKPISAQAFTAPPSLLLSWDWTGLQVIHTVQIIKTQSLEAQTCPHQAGMFASDLCHSLTATCRNVTTEKWIIVTHPDLHININQQYSHLPQPICQTPNLPHSQSISLDWNIDKSVWGALIAFFIYLSIQCWILEGQNVFIISPEYSNQFLHWRLQFLVTDHVTGGEVTKVPAACY